jgi:hypothetical protein
LPRRNGEWGGQGEEQRQAGEGRGHRSGTCHGRPPEGRWPRPDAPRRGPAHCTTGGLEFSRRDGIGGAGPAVLSP